MSAEGEAASAEGRLPGVTRPRRFRPRFHYELLVVAGMWSLLAVEAALRVRLDGREGAQRTGREPRFVDLVRRARREGLVTDEWAERLDAAREMRNGSPSRSSRSAW